MRSLIKILLLVLANTALIVGIKAQSVVELREKFDFSNLKFSPIEKLTDAKNGFAIKFRLNPRVLETNSDLLNIGNYFKIFVNDGELFCQLNFGKDAKAPSGRKCEVLKIRAPKGELAKINIPETDFIVFYDGINFVLSANGDPIDREYPYGSLPAKHSAPKIKAGAFYNLDFSKNVKDIVRRNIEVKRNAFINFWSPYGWNTWIGDVIVFYKDGLFHLFYLYDIGHHTRRWGAGAHIFRHMTTTDLINWRDHGALSEMNTQYYSEGTGSIIFQNGKYYFFYGLHTSRILKKENTISSVLRPQALRGEITPIDIADYPNLAPSGATYMTSKDGINFTPSNKFFNICENPGVYVNDDNTLSLNAGYGMSGVWNAKNVESSWSLVGKTPAGGMYNTSECPSYFKWGDYHYLIMGFTGFWGAKLGEELQDWAITGHDIYDGIAVPMVAEFKGDRRILAGWATTGRWGNVVIFRELVKLQDGRIGTKWLPEQTPKLPSKPVLSESISGKFLEIDLKPDSSYLLEISGEGSMSGRLALNFKNQEKIANEFQLNFDRQTAQFALLKDGRELAGYIRPFYENPELLKSRRSGFKNIAIAHVTQVSKPFKLRLLVKHDAKFGTHFDAEISQQRTLTVSREQYFPQTLKIIPENLNGEIKIKLFKLN